MMGYDGGWWFWGMHAFWWLFWIGAIAAFVWLLTAAPRGRPRETPLQILQRRLAAGEISEQEYEARKRTLERDGPR